jgi:hypothetical protein
VLPPPVRAVGSPGTNLLTGSVVRAHAEGSRVVLALPRSGTWHS